MSRNASLPRRIRTSEADPKSLENYPRKLDVTELSSSGHTVLCVWKPVALSVAVRARIPRHALWRLGAALAEESRSLLSQKTNPLIISIMV